MELSTLSMNEQRNHGRLYELSFNGGSTRGVQCVCAHEVEMEVQAVTVSHHILSVTISYYIVNFRRAIHDHFQHF